MKFFELVFAAFVLTIVSAEAQQPTETKSKTDLSAIVGRYVGDINTRTQRFRDGPSRTLDLRLNDSGGLTGLYGITGKSLDPVAITIMTEQPLSFQFMTGANSRVSLTLTGADLVGTLLVTGALNEFNMLLKRQPR